MIAFLLRPVLGFGKALLAFAVAWPVYLGLAPESEDEALDRALRAAAAAGRLATEAEAALQDDDLTAARGYAALAQNLGHALPAPFLERLETAEAVEESAAVRAGRCAEGAIAGGIRDGISAVCAIAADLTLFGDLRDLAIQGSRWAGGGEYDRMLLGLSAMGLGATALAATTGGGALPARLGLSVAKAAKRAGHVPPKLVRAVAVEARAVARGGDLARLTRASQAVETVRAQHGAGEAMRMLRHADSIEQLGEVSGMYARFGRLARPIMTLTGRTTLRGVKLGYKLAPALVPAAAMLLAGALVLATGIALRGRIERW